MNKVFLNALLRAFSPSGYEENATQVVQNYLDGVANFEFIDKVGNAAFSVGSGDVKIMLSGHIDEIALQVQNIDDKGFIRNSNGSSLSTYQIALLKQKGLYREWLNAGMTDRVKKALGLK